MKLRKYFYDVYYMLPLYNFVSLFQAAAKLINTFVAEKTHEKIKNLINANSLDDNTKMVLVNALYFKGLNAIIIPDLDWICFALLGP